MVNAKKTTALVITKHSMADNKNSGFSFVESDRTLGFNLSSAIVLQPYHAFTVDNQSSGL